MKHGDTRTRRFNVLLERALLYLDESLQNQDRFLLRMFRNSVAPAGEYGEGPLKDQDDETLMRIINRIRSIVPPQLKRYLLYYMLQVAKGHLSLHNIDADKDRIASTIGAFIRASRKQEWKGPRDIFKYPDWRQLEKLLIDSGAYNKGDKGDDKHSIILYTKTYTAQDNTGKPYNVTYWFRKILTVTGACKYGKGTAWCTAATKRQSGSDEPHPAQVYLDRHGLYIIERETDHEPRRPIIQASGHEVSGHNGRNVMVFTPRLARFIAEVLSNRKCQLNMDAETYDILHGMVESSKKVR